MSRSLSPCTIRVGAVTRASSARMPRERYQNNARADSAYAVSPMTGLAGWPALTALAS